MKPRSRLLVILVIFFLVIAAAFTWFFTRSPIVKPWLASAGQVCGWDGCHTSEVNQKYNYFLDQAVKTRHPDLCQQVVGLDGGDFFVSPETARAQCRAEYAGKTQDLEYCQQLNQPYNSQNHHQSVCYSSAADVITEKSKCYLLPDISQTGGKSFKNTCLTRIASLQHDPSICLEISDSYPSNYVGSRSQCLSQAGLSR